MNMPFPGMDPYLEHPTAWPSVHTRLIVALANQLRPLIRPRYVASVEERVYLEGPDQQRVPDVSVHKVHEGARLPAALAAVMDTPLVVEVEATEVREHYVAILDRQRGLRVVTVIEVVSPANKVAGPGRKSYQAKQRETLASEAHLVEVDLLRHGRHVVAVPEDRLAALGSSTYLASVSRWPHRGRFEAYLRGLRERLPRLRLPLAEPDADVPLDLQEALAQVYDEGDYVLRLRYDQPCEPTLAPDDQRWADERVAMSRAAHPELFAPPTDESGGTATP